MIRRALWLDRIQQAWSRRSIIWLSGVRRVGKTTLAQMLPEAVYMNCDLPSTRRALEAPELFLDSQAPGSVLILDDVHRLDDPSRLLKIAADEYPQLQVLATGSSTLAATGTFRDSLAGRKQAIHLCPVLWEECADSFGVVDLDRRIRDRDGTLIEGAGRSLIVSTDGLEFVTPEKGDAVMIGPGVYPETMQAHEIAEVRPLSPGGVVVIYEIDLAR